MGPLRILVNAHWRTRYGYTAVLVEVPDADYVGLALTDGPCLVDVVPMHATMQEAVEYCNAVLEPLGPLVEHRCLVPVRTTLDLAALNYLALEEASCALTHMTMPRRSMS